MTLQHVNGERLWDSLMEMGRIGETPGGGSRRLALTAEDGRARRVDIAHPDGEPLPLFASADYRLGNFDAITAGLKYGWRSDSGLDLSVRLEY